MYNNIRKKSFAAMLVSAFAVAMVLSLADPMYTVSALDFHPEEGAEETQISLKEMKDRAENGVTPDCVTEFLEINTEGMEDQKDWWELVELDTSNIKVIRIAPELGAIEPIRLSKTDYEALLKIVQSEAGSEDIEGKILVANVVLNRYFDEYFPNTIVEVVTQTSYRNGKKIYQFSPAMPNGSYWNAVPSEETIEAVGRALDGEDLSEGALYFAARDKADKRNMSWFDRSLTWLFKHGNHEFYK